MVNGARRRRKKRKTFHGLGTMENMGKKKGKGDLTGSRSWGQSTAQRKRWCERQQSRQEDNLVGKEEKVRKKKRSRTEKADMSGRTGQEKNAHQDKVKGETKKKKVRAANQVRGPRGAYLKRQGTPPARWKKVSRNPPDERTTSPEAGRGKLSGEGKEKHHATSRARPTRCHLSLLSRVPRFTKGSSGKTTKRGQEYLMRQEKSPPHLAKAARVDREKIGKWGQANQEGRRGKKNRPLSIKIREGGEKDKKMSKEESWALWGGY